MAASRRRHARSPAVAPLEDDDLLSEILVRLPPQPSSLPRASLVCKRWRRLVSDPAFCRRFRLRHGRNPPLLGFFDIFCDISFIPTLEAPDRVPPGRFSLQLDDGDGDFMSLGCRHGLVLIYLRKRLQILVWDPVTADQHRLAIPPVVAACRGETLINGAVLRDAGDVQHFQVVLVVAYDDDQQHRQALACVYLSKTGLWGDPIKTLLPHQAVQADVISFPTVVSTDVAVLAGDSLYWLLVGNFTGILEFDLEKQRLAVIRLPKEVSCWKLMRAEGGGLGLLRMPDSNCNTQLWKRKTNCDGVASWVLGRTMNLENILPLKPEEKGAIAILALAEGNNVLLLWTIIGLFVVNLESLKFKKLFKTMIVSQYYPFESVYTADIGGGHDGVDLLHKT
ncbi:F-box protein At5g03970 isoform X2 [Triticum aestivum]|uniref:F-box protein At5g03970 isoform X2 n=1 Tax=Triticum aestivum TaxID=4565 RepID=UPI001D02859D|nr:F-box protein At5g03970-like isoform X2 [Triticum aestivum]